MATNPNFQDESRFVNQVCSNTKTDFIEITEDKLENILIKFLRDLKNSNGWITPFSLFITILIVHLTSNFKEFLSISKEVWSSIFCLGLAISFIWLCYKVFFAIKNKEKTRIEFLINKIKNN